MTAEGTLPERHYLARLRGGPDDGALVRVVPLPNGEPPDFFHAGPDDPGVYVLAGLPHSDGSTPYWFMPSLPPSDEPPDHGTWTLVSIAEADGSIKVWHQHGIGKTPVPMRGEAVSSDRAPDLVGRRFVCPECDDATVVSLPTS